MKDRDLDRGQRSPEGIGIYPGSERSDSWLASNLGGGVLV
jgi:hypothetical protein